MGGHKVYGLRMDPPSGYRNDTTNGVAVGDEAETMYAVLNGSHYNDRCCFDVRAAPAHPPAHVRARLSPALPRTRTRARAGYRNAVVTGPAVRPCLLPSSSVLRR